MGELDSELEKQLSRVGNKLLSHSSSLSQLLSLLNRLESFLTGVEQSPSESMKKALSQPIKAVVSDELLRHSDVDVKATVASCISEITRITAPDAPYGDDVMKEVFQLIVSSFENLDDKSSPSYSKRINTLETLAKVRSCVMMLDLDCDELIFEMFQHFFRTIRDDHPQAVVSSMETVMALLLEDSEDVSLDLLSSILDFLRTENKEVRPIASQLAERVIVRCATKLKPYIFPAVKSRGAALDDYSKIVATICQKRRESVEPNDGDAASKSLADECDLANAPQQKAVKVTMETSDDSPPNEKIGPTTVRSPKAIMSNGNLQEIEDSSEDNVNSKEGDHETHDRVKADAKPSKTIAESLLVKVPTKCQSKAEKSNKQKGKKTNASKSSSKPSEPSRKHDTKKSVKVPQHRDKDSKGLDYANTDDSASDADEPADNKIVPNAAVSSPNTSENDSAEIPSPFLSESLADIRRSKKVVQGKKKLDSVQGEPKADVDSKKESSVKNTPKATDVSKTKSHKHSGKMVSSALKKEAKSPILVDASKKEEGTGNKSAKHSGKKVKFICQHDDEEAEQVKSTSKKDNVKTPSKDVEKKPLPESAVKSTKNGSDMEKASKTSSKKRSSSEVNASKTNCDLAVSHLVGSRIEVFWPDDNRYYEGMVDSFDAKSQKYKIVYMDGDMEVLNLGKETWRLANDESSADQGQMSAAKSLDDSSEMPKGKKAKISVEMESKQGKTDSAAKKKSLSSSKSETTPKPGKSKEGSSKSATKSEENNGKNSKELKAVNKSSDDKPKSAGKSKGDDKGKSSKSTSKSNTNGTDKEKVSPSSNDEGESDADMSPEPAEKTPEIAKGKSSSASKPQKSSMKRKREATS